MKDKADTGFNAADDKSLSSQATIEKPQDHHNATMAEKHTRVSSDSKQAPPETSGDKTADIPQQHDQSEDLYRPKTLKFWLVMFSTFTSMLLVALDRTILATAIPRITDEFKSLGDIGWYGSAYMLTTAAFQLLFGRIYSFYDLKRTFLISIVVFEVGSAICGAAPSSPVFIFGRAVAGMGSAGIMTGSIMTVIPLVPLHKRPVFQSIFGLVFGVASVAGPLLGGAFTQRATWRWCFYMNLPIGAVAFLFLFIFEFPKTEIEDLPTSKKLVRLDPIGTLLFIPTIVCLILALQWGGSTYAWSSWRIIVLFVFFGVGAVAFSVVQVLMPKSASLPWPLIKQRTMFSAAFYMLFLSGAMMLLAYYLPFWFQTAKGVEPIKSGVYTIPLVLSLVVSSILSGILTQKTGYYTPSMVLGPCIVLIGEGLLTTMQPSTGSSKWIAYQFLTGFGIGFGMQTANIAVQATVEKKYLATGMAIIFFAQQLGGAIFVSVGQTILSTVLVSKLSDIPGLDPQEIVKTGATELHSVVPDKYFGLVIDSYNYACTRIFLAAIAISAAHLLSSAGVEWKSIKKPAAPKPEDVEKQTTSE